MKKRIRQLLIAIPLLLLLGAGGVAWWLLYSESGSRWVLEQATAGLEDVLDIGSVEGSLSGGLVLREVALTAGDNHIQACLLYTSDAADD